MVAALLTTWVVDTAAAQSIFGRIAGSVTDSQGGSVAGVRITIVNEETKLERQTTTDSKRVTTWPATCLSAPTV